MTTTAGTLTEAAWQTRVIDTAERFGWRVFHARPARDPSGRVRTHLAGHRGFPDLLLARAGVVLAVELKTDRGRLGPGQAEWLAELGPYARLWRPADWDTVLAELRGR